MQVEQEHFVVTPGSRAGLAGRDTAETPPYESEEEAAGASRELATELTRLQDILMAHEDYGILMIVQGMDGAGKDGTIKHVMLSTDPQGCHATPFKALTPNEAKQDYLRRASRALPDRGAIAVFNRSYYEQVAIDRVHPEKLEQQTLPSRLKGPDLWQRRYSEINGFERYLTNNGIVVLKFYLHLSKARQRERLLERTELRDKMWKFSTTDIEDRERWDQYMEAYEDAISSTSTEWAPWRVIPADHRWYSALAVSSALVATLRSLHTEYPELSEEKRRELREARERLQAE